MAPSIDLTVENCAGYLGLGDGYRISELGGGVSNRVLLVESGGQRFVLKQSLGRLRVADDWRADRSRILREIAILREAQRILPRGSIPEVLWADEGNFLFAMSAAEPEAESWKEQLLAGRTEAETARRVGVLLGLLVRGSWRDAACEGRYGNQTAFDQLRIDPYYRTVAARQPEVAGRIGELIAESRAQRVSLVHGDWSPKNFLVRSGSVMVIDFEVVHYGDPSFDAAFCINHLLLKCFRRPELAAKYLELARVFYTWTAALLPAPALEWFEGATARHLGCLMLARVDGKSPAEYIREETLKEVVRGTARRMILERMARLEDCYGLVAEGAAGR